jgi:osmotically-inducible protein OsmY
MRNKLSFKSASWQKATALLALLMILPLTNGCVGFVAGAATGAAVAHDERSPGVMLEDETIEVKSKEQLYNDKALDDKIHINVTSYNHVVLLTGEVLSRALRDHAVGIVSKVEKVKRVHNEITVADLSSFSSRSNDTWITTKVKTNMLSAKGFDGTRVKVVTERGSVYLMGIVTQAEGKRAAEIARNVKGVKRVVKLFQYVTTTT